MRALALPFSELLTVITCMLGLGWVLSIGSMAVACMGARGLLGRGPGHLIAVKVGANHCSGLALVGAAEGGKTDLC